MKQAFLLSLLTGLVLYSSCTINEPCDPGQSLSHGLCVESPPDPGLGGGPQCEDTGMGGFDTSLQNEGEACTEGGDECLGGTVCGAPERPLCTALCGPCDPFFEACPNGTNCTDVGRAIVCL